MSHYLLAAPTPPDGRLQVWNVDQNNILQTRWKATSDPNSQWTTPWTPFSPPPPGPGIFILPDGRTQIWGLESNNLKVYTSWKVSTAHDSLWSGWSEFDTTPLTNTGHHPDGIAVATLPDKRLQLFIEDDNPAAYAVWTSWKTTTDPNSPWTPLKLL